MTNPDFELRGGLRAHRLTTYTPPDARVDGNAVTLDRREARSGLPPRTEPGKRYVNAVVERRVVGEVHEDR